MLQLWASLIPFVKLDIWSKDNLKLMTDIKFLNCYIFSSFLKLDKYIKVISVDNTWNEKPLM